MKVKELIDILKQFDGNTEVACYSYQDECDFRITGVIMAKTNEYGIDGCYCKGDSNFANDDDVIVLSDYI